MSPVVGVPTGTLHYRLVGVNPAGSPFTPGDPTSSIDSEHFYVTSRYCADHPWINATPDGLPDIQGDGQKVDWLTGKVEDGSYRVGIIDVPNLCTLGAPAADEELDGSIFSNGWELHGDPQTEPSPPFVLYNPTPVDPTNFGGWWDASIGVPTFSGFVLFFWFDDPGGPPYSFAPGSRDSYIEKTFTGFEPGERVGFHFHGAWTLDTGPGNIFAEIEGDAGPVRVSFPNGSYDFWTIDQSLTDGTIQDQVLAANANGSGEVTVRLGGENYAASANVYCTFSDLEIVRCIEDVTTGGGGPSAVATRYWTSKLADAFARQQMRGWAFYLETSRDLGETWTEVLFSGYLTDMELPASLVAYLTIGDTRKVERNTPAWRNVDVWNNPSDEQMTALLGGPIYRGLLPMIADFGLPIFRIVSQQAATAGNNGWVKIRYVANGNVLRRTASRLLLFQKINEQAQDFIHAVPTNTGTFRGAFADLRASLLLLTGSAPPAALEDLIPLVIKFADNTGDPMLMDGNNDILLQWGVTSTGTYPNGTNVRVLMTPRQISEAWPMHYQGNAVTFVTALRDRHGLPYNSTSAGAVSAALGGDAALVLRMNDPSQTVQELCEQVFARRGFSLRQGLDGVPEFFVFRQKPNSAPTLEITENTLREEGGPTYRIGATCNRVIMRSHLMTRWTDLNEEGDVPNDAIVERQQDTVFEYSTDGGETTEAETQGPQEQVYDLPGYEAWIEDFNAINQDQLGAGLARTVFEHSGRGVQEATLICRRETDADDARLGVPVLVSPSHLPNAQLGQEPTSQRGGSRVMRVVQRTEEPPGPVLLLEDEDTGVAYDGTYSIALADGTNKPTIYRKLTITGSTLLVADGAQLELEMQFTSGSTPSADSHGVLYTVLDAKTDMTVAGVAVDPVSIELGPVPLFETAWLRTRAFLVGGGRSAWKAWTGVGSGPPSPAGAISALVITNITTDGWSNAWTNTNTDSRVRVQLKETAAPASFFVERQASPLAPGSTFYVVSGLPFQDLDYDIRIVLVTAAGVEFGTVLTATVHTLGTAGATLGTPQNPKAFGGFNPLTNQIEEGTYGMRVNAVFPPNHSIVFLNAPETARGSGTPGAYIEVARVPALSGQPTFWVSRGAANAGILQYMKAYATAVGYTDSAETAVVFTDPFTGTPEPPTTGPLPGSVSASASLAEDAQATGSFTIENGATISRVVSDNNNALRLRLYYDSADRTSDLARDTSSRPTVPVFLDVVVITPFDYTLPIQVIVAGPDDPMTLYWTLTSYDAGTNAVSATVHYTKPAQSLPAI